MYDIVVDVLVVIAESFIAVSVIGVLLVILCLSMMKEDK